MWYWFDCFIDYRRARGYKAAGRPLHAIHNPNPRISYTITLLSSLSHPYGHYIGEPRSYSNTSIDFFRFVIDLIEKQHLISGDYFIVDNASIHHARDISQQLSTLLDTFNIRLIFLPTYSPELNPCELIFAQIKRHLRNRTGHNLFIVDLILAIARISLINVIKYYSKCILHNKLDL